VTQIEESPPARKARDVEPEPEKPSSRDEDEAELSEKEDDDTPSSRKKKERVLHTRVPAVLERELKRFADNLRIPVSNLVRTILEDALNVADAASENVEERLKKAARHIEHEREKLKKRVTPEPDPLGDVFAFQSVTLATAAECAKCGKSIKRGERANLGLSDAKNGNKRVFVCDACLPSD
jgi:hypothetical protein